MSNLSPCKFYIKGSDKALSYDEFRQHLAENYDTLVEPKAPQSPLKAKAEKYRAKAAELRKAAGGTLSALPNAIATAMEMYANILDTAATIHEAVAKFKATDEYKALEGDDKDAVDDILDEDVRELSEDTDAVKEIVFDLNSVHSFESGEERTKSFIDAVNKAEALSPEEKKRVNAEITNTYDTLTEDDLNALGEAFVEHMGGLDKAVKAAMNESSPMLASVRVYVLGQAIKDTKERRAKAKTEAEQNAISDEQLQYFDFLDKYVRDLGRATNRMKSIYALDNLAVIRDTQKKAERINKINAPQAKEHASKIVEIFEDPKDIADSLDEAVESTDTTLLEKRVKELEEELKKVQATKDKANKKNVKRKPKFTDEDLKKARKELFGGLSANPFLDPKKWQALSTIAAYYMERGYYAFEDFYKKIRKDLGGKHEEYYADLYKSVKQNLIESGVSESEFTDDDVVAEMAQKLYQEEERLKREIEDAKKKKETTAMSEKFAELMREKPLGQRDSKPRKTKAEKLREIAKELDSKFNTDVYSKQAEAYINSNAPIGAVNENDLLKDALIEAGFVKEVFDPKKGENVKRVDWQAVASDSKNIDDTIAKMAKVLEGKLSPEQVNVLLAKLKNKAASIIDEKKKKAVENYVNRNVRKRAGKIADAIKRTKTQTDKLVELWKQGGLDNKQVMEILSKELGIITITPEIERVIESKLNDIDKAPLGSEKELLEEDLQAYIESLGLDNVALAWFDRLRLRLFGPATLIVNLSGATTSAHAAYNTFVRNQLPIILGKGGDKYIGKIASIAAQKSIGTMGDILMNGGVDLGSAFSETTGTKEGTPRVRYAEYTYRRKWFNKPLMIKGNNANLYSAMYDREKYIGRFMSASDAFSQIVLQEIAAYDEMKHTLRKLNPTMSNKEAAEKAFEMMYAVSIEDANKQAAKEFKERGIEFDFSKKQDRARFKRRVFEIVQQARSAEIQKASILFANRYTFKAQDYGVSTVFVAMAKAAKTAMYSMANMIEAASRKANKEEGVESKLAHKTANAIRNATELAFVKYAPFINGVANIMEKGFELSPYGVLKGGVQAGVLGITGEGKEYTYRRAFDTAMRGVNGTILLMIIAGMLADRDKDGNPALYGGGPEDPAMKAVATKANQVNTIRIFGHSIPLSYLGVIGVPLKIMGDYYDNKRYHEEVPNSVWDYMAYVGGVAVNSANDLYVENLKSAINQAKGQDPSKFWSATIAELTTRTTIPFMATLRQGEVVAFPQATVPIGLAENFAKYSGIIAGWSVDRPNFDYRGHTYQTGEKYTGSPAGVWQWFKKTYPKDEVDEFMMNYHPSMVYQRQGDYQVSLDALSAASAPISDEQFYDLKFDTAKNFGSLIEAYVKKHPEKVDYELENVSKETSLKAAKDMAKNMLQQEGVEVDLNNKQYVEELTKRTEQYLTAKNKGEKIKRDISELYRIAEQAAMYDLVGRLGGVHALGTENDKKEYEDVLKSLKK